VGNRLADGLGVADLVGVAVLLADGLGVADGLVDVVDVGDADGLVEPLADIVGAAPAPGLLGAVDDVAELVTEGENIGVVVPGDDVQPAIAAEPSRVKVPKPTAVSLVLSAVPARAVRTFIKPPHAPASGEPFPRSRHYKPASEAKTRSRPGRCSRRAKAGLPKRRRP
jgi:hypothetical protein